MSHDQHIDQSATSIQSLLNTNGASFLMTSHVRLYNDFLILISTHLRKQNIRTTFIRYFFLEELKPRKIASENF